MGTRAGLRAGVWLAAAVIAAALLGSGTQARQASLPPQAIGDIRALMQAEMTKAKVPGASVAIAWQNHAVFSEGFGLADVENSVKVTADTAFRTASVAKPMTATAVMQLVEQGKIDLDAPIQKYCPAFPEKQWPVTARHILGHQSGIRHYGKRGESASTTFFASIVDSLAMFRNDPLLFEPGTQYLYTTFGFSVLGCAIEGASGTSYDEYMRDHVFATAGMTRTRLDRIYEIIPNRARGYMALTAEAFAQLPPAMKRFAKAGEIYNAPLHDTSMKIPGGGLVSTSGDLARFGAAAIAHRLVTRETQDLMWTNGTTRGGQPTGVGFGWGVSQQDGLRRLSHSGNQIGGASVLHVLPEIGVSYAIMVNLEDTDMAPFHRGIAAIVQKYMVSR